MCELRNCDKTDGQWQSRPYEALLLPLRLQLPENILKLVLADKLSDLCVDSSRLYIYILKKTSPHQLSASVGY